MIKAKLLLAILSMVCFIGLPSLLADQESDRSKSPDAKSSATPGADIFAKPVSFIFTDVPLSAAMESISKQVGVQILLDLNGLDIAEVSPEVSISKEVIRRPLKEALDEILAPLGLTCIVKMGILLVTDLEDTGAQMVTKVYPVADLLPGFPQKVAATDPGAGSELPRSGSAKKKSWDDQDAFDATKLEAGPQAMNGLAEIIRRSALAANQYSTVDALVSKSMLAISATQSAHQVIENDLAIMRKYRSTVLQAEATKGSEKK